MDLKIPNWSVPKLDTTITVNLAAILNAALDLAGKVQKTLKSGFDVFAEIRNDPSLLLRMVPRDLRCFPYNIALGGFTFTGSAYLLTPEELLDELWLFFDSKRKMPRGLAANNSLPSGPVPTGEPVDEIPTLSATQPIVSDGEVSADFHQRMTAKLTAHAVSELEAKLLVRKQGVNGFASENDLQFDATALAIANQLIKTAAKGSGPLTAAIGELDFSPEVAAVLYSALTARRPILVSRRQADAFVRRIQEMVKVPLLSKMAVTTADAILNAPPEELAQQIVSSRMKDRLRPVPLPPRPSPFPIPPGPPGIPVGTPRRDLLEAFLPARDRLQVSAQVNSTLGALDRNLATAATPAVQNQVVAVAKAQIATIIGNTYHFVRGAREVYELAIPGAAPLIAQLEAGVKAIPIYRPLPAASKIDVPTLAADYFADLLDNVITSYSPASIPTGDRIEQVVGYQIQITEKDASYFSVPAPSGAAQFKVQLIGGSYQLLVRNGAAWDRHKFPMAEVDLVAEGPDKERMLRGMLSITPLVVLSQPTPEQAAAVAERWESEPALYYQSIFNRDEYQLMPTGGKRGPFNVADLFGQQTGPSGEFTVPAAPALMAGFKITLFDGMLLESTLAMAGILLGGDHPSAFLYGHHQFGFDHFGLTFSLEGDFVATIGAAWTGVTLPGGMVIPNGAAIAFKGRLKVSGAQGILIDASATGTFIRDPADSTTTANFKVNVTATGAFELSPAEVKLFKVRYEIAGDLELNIDSEGFSFANVLQAVVYVAVGTFPTKTVVETPATRLCVSAPTYVDGGKPPIQWNTICRTIPGVEFKVPDLSRPMQWGSEVRVTGDVLYSREDGRNTFRVEFKKGEFDEIGTFEIPDLLANNG